MLRAIDLPPVWGAGFAAAIWAWADLATITPLPPVLRDLGWVLIALAGLLALWAIAQFLRFRTPIEPRREPRALVTSGPYRLTRNPMYRALVALLLGWALLCGEGTGALIVPLYALVLLARFVGPEEKALEAAFGDEYRAWAGRVRSRL